MEKVTIQPIILRKNNAEQLKKATEVLRDKDCYVTTMTVAALSQLGLEALDWEPEVVASEFCRAFDMPPLGKKAFDKLQAGLSLVGTTAFTTTIEGFLAATKVMCNKSFDQTEVPFCDLKHCSWSVYEYKQLVGAEDELPFCSEIVTYIQSVGNLHGMYKFPEWLSFADRQVSVPDNSDDAYAFELYNQRQQEYGDILVAQVNEEQKKLASQLDALRRLGLIAKDDRRKSLAAV